MPSLDGADSPATISRYWTITWGRSSFDGIAAKSDPPVEVILVLDMANVPFQEVAFTELDAFVSARLELKRVIASRSCKEPLVYSVI